MKVLSLFDGISCGRVALERAGIPISRYVAYEIDQNAINCSNWNYPDIEHKGSVTGGGFMEYKGFDIVMGGFPCQDLSVAGKQKGLTGKRSSLFWYLVEAIETVKPRYFLVENNHGMPKKAKDIITETLQVEPICIDASLVSAQDRKRLYWTNIPGIEQPEDRGLLLKDVLEYGTLCELPAKEKILDILSKKHSRVKTVKITDKGVIRSEKPDGSNISEVGSIRTLYHKSPTLITAHIPYVYHGPNFTIRRLTPLEMERLQGLPDFYTDMIPKTRRCHAIGNGWNVDTIAHIFNYINVDMLI